MDASEQFAFPSPQPQDAQEVREAIEQAGILWSEDPKESLKWLRKAAEFASDAGDDLRSVQLAKVSADLRNLANISPSIPPPTTLPPISHPLPSAPVAVGDSTEAAAASVAAVVVAPSIAAATGSDPTRNEQTGREPSEGTPAPESGTPVWSAAENTVRDQAAVEQQPTPDAPSVVSEEATATPAAPPAASAAEPVVAIPQFTFSKDPAQTVPATPAASAAAIALASAPSNYQSVPAPASAAPAAAPATVGAAPVASGPGFGAPLASAANGAALGAKRPVLFGGPTAPSPGGPRPEQPTLVGRPLPLGNPNGPRGVNDETPAATPAAIQADSVAPGSNTTRFVQHKAIAVSISMAPNASGHFDLHPLAEGESVEPGFRRALLIALAPEDRLFPGRG